MTVAEYFQTPETVLPQELVYGALRVAEAPTAAHQRVVRDIAFALMTFVNERRLGEVLFSPMDVVLDVDADLVVQPDILYVSAGRSHVVTNKVFGAPDLVVEVLSPNPRIGKLDERVEWFARYGVRECWLVRLPERRIEVLALEAGGIARRNAFADHQTVISEVLEGLPLKPLDIFGW